MGMGDVSLIVEGGGLRGFFAVGALACLREAGYAFPYVIGISSGALCSIAYLSGKDVDPGSFAGTQAISFLNPRGFVSLSQGLLRTDGFMKALSHEDLVRAIHGKATFLTAATCARTARLTWWDAASCPTPEDLADRVRASSSIPVLMPRATVAGEVYADGGIMDSIPLSRALSDGKRRHVLILSRPAGYRKGRQFLDLSLRRWLKPYPRLRWAMLTRHVRYNASLELVEEQERLGMAVALRPQREWHGRFVYSPEAFQRDYEAGWRVCEQALPQIRALLS